MKIIKYFSALCLLVLSLTSCDRHYDFPDTSTKIGDVLCTDGEIVRFEEMQELGKQPIAIVFYVNQSEEKPGTGYAVYLWDSQVEAFSDSIGIKQDTSADPTAYDGNSNTFAMYASGISPAAQSVYDLWYYGQSAYIPSVAEFKLLFDVKESVNSYIEKCGGDTISDEPDECWYWTSTEVQDMETAKAWLFSMASGALQETPKEQKHKVRPIITLYN